MTAWSAGGELAFPVAPVVAVTSVILRDRLGAERVLAVECYRLEADRHRPKLRGVSGCLPAISEGDDAVVAFNAGYGAWADVPADLQQAVLLLAAHYYEYCAETALARGCMPFGVTNLIERFRQLRIGVGAV